MNREKPAQRFGEKLRALRTQHGLTFQQTARQLGLSSHSYIMALESGEKLPSIRFVLAAAYLFNVTTDQLLKDELELEIVHANEPMGRNAAKPQKRYDSK